MSIKETQLAELAAQLEKCSSCHLREDCQAPVGWYGCPDSPIVFIGEGPGGVEDDYGCPLIGPSGQLLDKALWSVQMTRDRVLTSNIVKCRPKGNRTPDLSEADFCAKIWLERELAGQNRSMVHVGNRRDDSFRGSGKTVPFGQTVNVRGQFGRNIFRGATINDKDHDFVVYRHSGCFLSLKYLVLVSIIIHAYGIISNVWGILQHP